MNCQEVMELMQRKLDDDLDAQEELQLQSHMEHCLDCALMYERLQLLSDELTKLPKVVPAYSLVDAILPRLSEIDRQAAAVDGDVAVPPSSAPVQPSDEPRKLPWTRRFGSQISWKLAGGVVAAGLVIGFMIYGSGSGSISNNADGLLQPLRKSASEESSASQQIPQAPAANTNGKQEAGGTASGSANQRSQMMTDQSGEPAAPSSAPAASPAQADTFQTQSPAPYKTGSDNGAGGSAASAPAEETKQEPAAPVKITGTNAATTAPTPAAATETPAPQQSASLTGPSPSPLPGDNEEAIMDKMIAQKAPEAADAPPADSDFRQKNDQALLNGIRSNTGAANDETTMISLDNRYSADVKEQRVLIRDTGTGETLFTSKLNWKDTDVIKLLSWSEDNKLTYQVKSGETTHSYLIDVAARTEILLSP